MRSNLLIAGLWSVAAAAAFAQEEAPPGAPGPGAPGPGGPQARQNRPFTEEEIAKIKANAQAKREGRPGQIIEGEKGVIIGNNIPAHLESQIQQILGGANPGLISGSDSESNRVRNILTTYQSLKPEDIESRISTLETRGFLTTRQVEDPFGLGMDGELPQSEEVLPGEEPKEKPPTLQDAVGTLVVRGVIPDRKEFLSEGGQNIFEGDRIQLAFRGQSFHARVERVEERRIVFRDRVSGDRAILPLNLGPRDNIFGTVGSTGTPFLQPMPPVNPIEGRND